MFCDGFPVRKPRGVNCERSLSKWQQHALLTTGLDRRTLGRGSFRPQCMSPRVERRVVGQFSCQSETTRKLEPRHVAQKTINEK